MPRLGDGKLENGVIQRAGANNSKWVSNIGFSYSAGIFRITDAQGNKLTPLNPGFITMPSVNPGQLAVLKVTQGYEFHDFASGSSNLTNFGFGINEGVDSTADQYFYIGVANRADSDLDGQDGSSCFYLGRKVFTQTPSASANIGDLGAIAATDTIDSMLMMLDLTIANYTDLITQNLLSIRMRWIFANTDWTVQTLSALKDQQTSGFSGNNWAPGTVKMPFYMASAPIGWTLDTSVNDAFIRISNTAGGVTGGAFGNFNHLHTGPAHAHDDGTLYTRAYGWNNDTTPNGNTNVGELFLVDYEVIDSSLPDWSTNIAVSDAESYATVGTFSNLNLGLVVDGNTGSSGTGNTSSATLTHGSAQHDYADFIICVNQ